MVLVKRVTTVKQIKLGKFEKVILGKHMVSRMYLILYFYFSKLKCLVFFGTGKMLRKQNGAPAFYRIFLSDNDANNDLSFSEGAS